MNDYCRILEDTYSNDIGKYSNKPIFKETIRRTPKCGEIFTTGHRGHKNRVWMALKDFTIPDLDYIILELTND
jgi:hypothetical protein